jgi:hypothetical protein
LQLKFQFHVQVPFATLFCSGGTFAGSQFQFQFQIHVDGSELSDEFPVAISAVGGDCSAEVGAGSGDAVGTTSATLETASSGALDPSVVDG